jgi:hypothetical protein
MTTGRHLVMRAYTQEIFGPVTPVLRIESVEQAIELARDTDYPPRGLPPGPQKGTPRRGGTKPGYRYPWT